MSYVRLFLYTPNDTYHLYLGSDTLNRLDINLSALEKLESWSIPKAEARADQEHAPVQIFDNKNNEVVIVGNGPVEALPKWLGEWLQERGYHIPADGILKTVSTEEFTKALNDTEIYYFGRNNALATEIA